MTELPYSCLPKVLRCGNSLPKPAEKALKAVFTGLMSSQVSSTFHDQERACLLMSLRQTFRDAFNVCDTFSTPTATAFSIASKLYQLDVFSSVDIHPVMINLLKWWVPSPSDTAYSTFTGIANALLGQMPPFLQSHFKDEVTPSFVLSAETDCLEDISSLLPGPLPSTIIALAPLGQFFQPVDGLLRLGNVNYAIRTTVDFTGSIQLWWQPSSQWFNFRMNNATDIPSPTKFDFGKPSAVFLERLQPNQSADDVSSVLSTYTVDWPAYVRLSCALPMEPAAATTMPPALVRTYGEGYTNVHGLFPSKHYRMVRLKDGSLKLHHESHTWEVGSIVHNFIDKHKSESLAHIEGCVVFMQCGAVSLQNLRACRSINNINEIALAMKQNMRVDQKAELIEAVGLAMVAQDRLNNFHFEARIDTAADTTSIGPVTFRPMVNAIKVKHCKFLTEVRIANLGSLWPTFAASAQGIFFECEALLHIDFSSNVIRKGTLRCLFDTKKKVKGDVKITGNIATISVSNCKLLETGGVEDVAMIIKACSKTLRSLRLNDCDLEMNKPEEAGLLAAIASCTNLNRLGLFKNKIADAGARKLAGSIDCLTALIELDLYNNLFVADGGPAIANAIKNCSYLWKFRSNLLQGSGGGVALSRALQQSNNIHHLHLSKNLLKNDGMRAVCMDLGRCRNLLSLDLMGNEIGDAGARDLANVFQFLTNLKLLNLYENSMTESGGSAIARELRKLPNLTTFHSNRLGVQGCLLLAGSMDSMPKLTSLLIAFNNINSEGMAHLAPAISKATQLVTLDTQDNELGDAGFELLSSLSLIHISEPTRPY